MLQTASQKDIWVKPAPDIAPRKRGAPAVQVLEEAIPHLATLEFPRSEKKLRNMLDEQIRRFSEVNLALLELETHRWCLDDARVPADNAIPLGVAVTVGAFAGTLMGALSTLTGATFPQALNFGCLVFGSWMAMHLFAHASHFIHRKLGAVQKTCEWYVNSSLSRLEHCNPQDREELFEEMVKTMNEEREELRVSVKHLKERLEKEYGGTE